MRKHRFTPFRKAWVPLLLGAAAALSAATLPHTPPAAASPGYTEPPAPAPLPWPSEDPVTEFYQAGYLPGGGGISAAGDYRYSLPIEVPDGRAGMQPRISLNYSSRAGNGPLGVGWSVDYGGSEITRCSRTFNLDGKADSPNYDPDDALCLDGERLVLVGGAGPMADGAEYRTHRDRFAKIVAHDTQFGAPASFEVFEKSGLIRTYKALVAQRIAEDGSVAAATPVWVMTEERDRSGNAVIYKHDVEYQSAAPYAFEYRISSIQYTAKKDGAGNLEEAPLREVQFDYVPRPDPSFAYRGGIRYEQSQRLHAIRLHAPNPTIPGEVGVYWLTYENLPDVERSFLIGVRRQDGLHQSGPQERRFDWYHDIRPEFELHELPQLSSNHYHGSNPIVFDADNDGKDDLKFDGQLCRTSSGSAEPFDHCVPTPAVLHNQPVDINGDGRADLFKPGEVVTWNSNTNAFETLPFGPGATEHMIDIDGDGRIDSLFKEEFFPENEVGPSLCPQEEPDNPTLDTRLWQWKVRRNNGQGFDEPIVLNQLAHRIPQPAGDQEEMTPALFDLNGDGRGELHVGSNCSPIPSTKCAAGGMGAWNWHALGLNDYGVPGQTGAPAHGSPCTGVLVDLNGDGLKDRLSAAGPDSKVRWATGTGFLLPEPFPTDIFPRLGKHRFQVADIDGDGREDIISSHESSSSQGQDSLPSTYLHVPRNDGLHRIDLGAAPYDIPSYDPTLQQDLQVGSPVIKTGDVNGDGLTDLIVVERAAEQDLDPGHVSIKVLIQKWQPHGLIHTVWDELGTVPRESVFYSTRPTDSPSTPTCQYPARCVRDAMVTAREHWTHRHDNSALRITTYELDDPRTDLRGRGFLGFGTVKIADPQSHAETRISFDHQTHEGGRYPFAGMPKDILRIVPILPESPAPGGGVLLPPEGTPVTARVTRVSNKPEFRLINDGATYAVFPKDSRVDEWEQNVKLSSDGLTLLDDGSETPHRVRETTRIFNDFGDEEQTKTWTWGGQRCESTATFDDLTGDWLIGLQRTSEVTCNKDGLPLPEARLTAMAYDTLGRLEAVTVEPDHPDYTLTTAYTRDDYGLVTRVKHTGSGKARKTFIAYDDEHLYARATWNDLGHYTRQLLHPALGVPVIGEDPNGIQVHYSYDRLGRVVEVAPDDAPATVVSYQYDPDETWAVQVTRTSEDGAESTVRLDEWDRTLETAHRGFDGEWIVRKTGYNQFGRASRIHRPGKVTASSLSTEITFDTLGRTLSVVDPDGATTTMVHSMYETTTTDPEGRKSRVTRDVDDRVIETANLLGADWVAVTYLYGKFSQVEDVVDPEGNIVHAMYDKLGRRTYLEDPDRGPTAWTYNALGEVTSEIDALGDTTVLERDEIGRVTWTMHDQNGVTAFAYDGNNQPGERGRLTGASSPDGVSTTYDYDHLGRNMHTIWQVGAETYEMTRVFDDFGRIDTIEYPIAPGRDPFVVKREYNPRGYAHELYDWTNPNLPKLLWKVTDRNENDLLRTSVSGNDVAEARQFDPVTGRLTNIEAVKNGVALYAMHYVRDDTGNVIERHDYAQPAPRVETFEYDDLDRLQHWTVLHANETRQLHYTYDLLGNIETVIGAGAPEIRFHDGVLQNGTLTKPHALTSRITGGQSTTYSYDDRGRQIAGGGRAVTYKPFDLPAEILDEGLVTTFSYDAFGTRVRKLRTVPGAPAEQEGVDTIDGLYERRWTDGGPVEHVFYVHGTDGPVAQVVYAEDPDKPEQKLFFHKEALGSVGLVTDNQGAEVERTYFDPFGAKTNAYGEAISPAMNDVKLGFTGHRHDDELGLIDMRGRIYDPAQKRFLTPDPFIPSPLFGQSYNRYSYVHNNPLRFTDPTGFMGAEADLERDEHRTTAEGVLDPNAERVVATLEADETVIIGKSDQDGFQEPGGAEAKRRREQRERHWSEMKHLIWGAVKQVVLSTPPVAAGRRMYHNGQLAMSAVGHAAEGDWDLAASALLEIPQQTAEAAGSIITGPIEAAMALPATINVAMNAPDPEDRGAAAVAAVQQGAAVVAAVVGAAAAAKGARDAGGTVRIRHYSNSKGMTGIQEGGVIKSGDKGSVFAEPVNRTPGAPRDVEARYQIKPGHGRHYVETDVPASRVERVNNPRTKSPELKIRGDVPLSNPTFFWR